MAVPVIGKNGEMLAALAIQAPAGADECAIRTPTSTALRLAAAELAEIFQNRA